MGRTTRLPVIRGGIGIWHGPQFRRTDLLTRGLQSRIGLLRRGVGAQGRPVPLLIHRQSAEASVRLFRALRSCHSHSPGRRSNCQISGRLTNGKATANLPPSPPVRWRPTPDFPPRWRQCSHCCATRFPPLARWKVMFCSLLHCLVRDPAAHSFPSFSQFS